MDRVRIRNSARTTFQVTLFLLHIANIALLSPACLWRNLFSANEWANDPSHGSHKMNLSTSGAYDAEAARC